MIICNLCGEFSTDEKTSYLNTDPICHDCHDWIGFQLRPKDGKDINGN